MKPPFSPDPVAVGLVATVVPCSVATGCFVIEAVLEVEDNAVVDAVALPSPRGRVRDSRELWEEFGLEALTAEFDSSAGGEPLLSPRAWTSTTEPQQQTSSIKGLKVPRANERPRVSRIKGMQNPCQARIMKKRIGKDSREGRKYPFIYIYE